MGGLWGIITNAVSVKLLWPLMIASLVVNIGLGYTVRHFWRENNDLIKKTIQLESDIEKHKSLSEEVREQIKLKDKECARLLEYEKTKPVQAPILDNDTDLERLLDELRLKNTKRKGDTVNSNRDPKAP